MTNNQYSYTNWSTERIEAFRRTVLEWYDHHKRDLPWRHTRNPYYIWVSEIMAQQTQVGTVVPYYERFIRELPTIEALANAKEETLLNLWQGLGYYSRVRNMQQAAQQIMKQFSGNMPSTMKELLSLKGIGPYTAAAIGSIAFNLVEPAIDGNLLRVVARLFEVDADIAQPKSRKIFENILYELIDPIRPGDFNQALMDIGATIMTPANLTPELNPLKEFDQSYQNGTAHLYPVKKKKIKQTHHSMIAYCIQNTNGEWLLRQHQTDELLTGLWHFPMIEQEMIFEEVGDEELIEPLVACLEKYAIPIPDEIELSQPSYAQSLTVKHIFSHRVWHVTIIPVQVNQIELINHRNWQWASFNQLSTIPLSTLQIKMQQLLIGEER